MEITPIRKPIEIFIGICDRCSIKITCYKSEIKPADIDTVPARRNQLLGKCPQCSHSIMYREDHSDRFELRAISAISACFILFTIYIIIRYTQTY